MEKILKVIESHCPQNHKCPAVEVCPVGALEQKGFSAPTVRKGMCVGCGKCTRVCPKAALILV